MPSSRRTDNSSAHTDKEKRKCKRVWVGEFILVHSYYGTLVKIRVSSTAARRAGQFTCNFIRGSASNQTASMATLGILEHRGGRTASWISHGRPGTQQGSHFTRNNTTTASMLDPVPLALSTILACQPGQRHTHTNTHTAHRTPHTASHHCTAIADVSESTQVICLCRWAAGRLKQPVTQKHALSTLPQCQGRLARL